MTAEFLAHIRLGMIFSHENVDFPNQAKENKPCWTNEGRFIINFNASAWRSQYTDFVQIYYNCN